MGIDDLTGTVGSWLTESGPEGEIVISSRVRLARNLRGRNFLTRCDKDEREDIANQVCGVLEQVAAPGQTYFDMTDLPELDRRFLVERHLISKELASGKGHRGVAFPPSETVSAMINEEDHLRIQALQPGLAVSEAFAMARDLDRSLESRLEYAFSPQFGYLTVCPTNVGTGLRASMMLHLPALVFTKQIEKVFQAVSKINLTVRGFYGEGTQATGDFYQISNQVTLGRSEEDILEELERVVPRIISYERSARELWAREDRLLMEDRVYRALGMLQAARKIPSEEALDHLSAVRMGVHLGLVNGVAIPSMNELSVLSLPAHLQKQAGTELPENERDIMRATFLRDRLAGATARN